MPKNPSEIQRLIEEREAYIKHIKDKHWSKAMKEEFVARLRLVDKQLGHDSGPYNSKDFPKPLD